MSHANLSPPSGLHWDSRESDPECDHDAGMPGASMPGARTYGSTDELGWQAAENRTRWAGLHANLLHLLGINHERLTHDHNGVQRRLTNVHGKLLPELIG